jgi:hypothetical protein
MTELSVVGVAELESQVCSATGCEADPVAVRVAVTPGRGLGIMWLCSEHARETHESEVDIHLIQPTCGSGGETKCGALTTHIAVVDEGNLPHPLRVVSVCSRHVVRDAGAAG